MAKVLQYCKYTTKPGMAAALHKEVAETGLEKYFRAVPGCICFNFSMPANDEDTYYLMNAYDSEEAFIAHKTCPGVAIWKGLKEKYVLKIEKMRVDPEDFTILDWTKQ